MHAWFWWGNLRERDHMEDLDIDGRTELKWVFKKWNGEWEEWNGLIWFRTVTGGVLL